MTTEDPSPSPPPLDLEAVRKIASLARLAPDDEQLAAYRHDLVAILDHVATLSALDVEGVEPMTRPHEATNRFDEDEVRPSMPIDDLLRNAPAVRGPYVDVPKVLGEGGG